MKSKYEISVWVDIPSEDGKSFIEKKLVVIGSNTMTSESRARDPKLVNNINGTNKFTFNMYYSYIDTRTGEKIKNPYIQYLVNERKIKVFWKDEWYDLLIKQIKEDQVNHVFSYTCEDAYITELSRTGFQLQFATELQNNIGTARELVESVLDGTDWRFNEDLTEKIYQQTEEAVYEATTLNEFEAICDVNGEEVRQPSIIKKGQPILIYYSYAPDINNLKTSIQFYYTGARFVTDENEMLVTNGKSYTIDVTWQKNISNTQATAFSGETALFTIDFSEGLSKQYRAERYVQSQQTKYIDILERYVNVYTKDNKTIYGYQTTKFDDALAVVNLITNPSNFSNISGWIGKELYFKLSPTFNKDTVVSEYKATSYLYMPKDTYYNTGIQNNRAYTEDGYLEGDVYICRIKARTAEGEKEPCNCQLITQDSIVVPSVMRRPLNEYTPIEGSDYFEVQYVENPSESGWLEYKMTCIRPCPYDEILSSSTPFGFFLKVNQSIWLEEIQFFHEVFGSTAYNVTDKVRINPGQMNIQSIAQIVWKYFSESDLEQATTKDDLIQTISTEPLIGLEPVYNDFERYGTIEADDSNRFNILQTIAEIFQCWVRFKTEHDLETGYIKYKNGLPEKYVYLTRETGQFTGIGFIYGVDLKSIVRNIKSDKISTKTIVLQNENEFGQNGFCTIARSEQNYPRDNFILNFDYYIQHGLLDREQLYKDLYGDSENDDALNYYTNLHDKNVIYANNLELLVNKKLELTRQTAMQTVYTQYISASEQELSAVENDLIKLASAEGAEDPLNAALEYAKSHSNFTKVQTLINDRSNIQNIIDMYKNLNTEINESISILETFINDTTAIQENIIDELRDLNARFFKKYSRYIQEGTWTSEDYWDDTLYYLDALQVAYTSSRPQISYEINVLRLSDIPEYSSKKFKLGDISFIQDTKYFGYTDKFTPYKEKVILSEITSCFDTPDKDTIKVQNYKTQFDDLFQRITASVQNLQFTEGKYAKAANIMNTDGTIRSSVIQNTFAENSDLVYGAQNESARIDNTGVTVTNNADGSKQVKVTSGGVFITSDGGTTWNNAIRGDGITADVVTTGKLNTELVTIYGADAPSFTWDQYGINAYGLNSDGSTDYNQYVRFDKYGIYGIEGQADYRPKSEQDIYDTAKFGLTWNRFFMYNKTKDESGVVRSIEISTDSDIVIREGAFKRVVIGRLNPEQDANCYGILVADKRNDEAIEVFRCDKDGAFLSGWTLTEDCLSSKPTDNQQIKIYSNGNIGCYSAEAATKEEGAYIVVVRRPFEAINLENGNTQFINSFSTIYPFVNSIGKIKTQRQIKGKEKTEYNVPTAQYIPEPPKEIYFAVLNGDQYINYKASFEWEVELYNCEHTTSQAKEGEIDEGAVEENWYTTYTYNFKFIAKIDNTIIFEISPENKIESNVSRYIPAADTKWCIDNEGYATFHDIRADGGQIAGWWIDNQSIYQTYDGTSNRWRIVGKETVSNIKTELSSTGTATKDNFDYSIITDAINAAMANIGGVLMSGGLINGYSIAAIAAMAAQAAADAWQAQQTANAANAFAHNHAHTVNYTNGTTGAVTNAQGTVAPHQHVYGFSTRTTGTF